MAGSWAVAGRRTRMQRRAALGLVLARAWRAATLGGAISELARSHGKAKVGKGTLGLAIEVPRWAQSRAVKAPLAHAVEDLHRQGGAGW